MNAVNLGLVKPKMALISVSDKTGIVDLARMLAGHHVHILSTGGTAKTLKDEGVKVTEVSDYTGFPEMLDGRVKTLHPAIHGGLLARRQRSDHMETIKQAGFLAIDIVVVNLYPFAETLRKPGVTEEEIVENIDIGGPTMLRSAAKNFESVAVVCDPVEYGRFGKSMELFGGTTLEYRQHLMGLLFQKTALYDLGISFRFAPFVKFGAFDWE